MFDLEKLRDLSLWRIIKSLPFTGGASATKWVYLAGTGGVTLGWFLLVCAFCWTYVRSANHEASVVVAGVITTLATAIIGFSVNSVNKRRLGSDGQIAS